MTESWRLQDDGGQFPWEDGAGEQEDESVTAGFLSEEEEEETRTTDEPDSFTTSSPEGSAFSHLSTTTDDSSPGTGGSFDEHNFPSSLSTTSQIGRAHV